MKQIILLLSIFSLSSCSLLNNASKNAEDNNRKYSAQKSIRNTNKKVNSIEYIQAKAKVSFRDNEKMKSNTVTFRISSGEKLWINAALGAARILIDNDSIKYYNKIEKNFFASDFSYVNDKIGIKANYEVLEKLLLGILIQEFSPSSLFKKSKDSYIFKENQFILNSKSVESTVTISPYNFTIIKQTFTTDENLFEVIYDDYIKVEKQNFPTKISFINNGLENFNIELKSISSLDKINIPFRIPKNYKRIELE